MLAFVLRPLWKQLKGPLQSVLKDKFSLLGGQFKAVLSSTIDDLVAAIQEAYFSTEIWKHVVKIEVEEKKGDKSTFRYTAFPRDSMVEASKIRTALVALLGKNLRLNALRTTAGISDSDWAETLKMYAGNVLRFGLPIALNRMIRNESPISSQEYIVDLAEAEPMNVNQLKDGKIVPTAGFHRLVVVYAKSTSKGSPSLEKATKIWKKRNGGSYAYTIGNYDGFKAS